MCLALGAALLTSASPSAATVVDKPVTKGLGRGAIYQAPLTRHSCLVVDPEARLGRQRCTEVQELNRVDITVRPQAAPDSRALYIADQAGVLVLRRDAGGVLAFDSCAPLTGDCGEDSADGTRVSEVVPGPGGHQLYVVIERSRDGGTEIHAMGIGANDRLTPDPSCLLLIAPQQYSEVANPRNCRVDPGAERVGGYGLTFTPNGRFGYLMSSSAQSASGILELGRAGDGSLSVLPGCVSGTGDRGFDQPHVCETILPQAQSGGQILNLEQLTATPDSSGLVVRGNDTYVDHIGGFLARFTIGADGRLTRNVVATGCVNATGNNGCSRSTALLGDMSSIAVVGSRVYVGTSKLVNPVLGIFNSNVLAYLLGADGGLSLPAGAAGCVGNVTQPFRRVKKLGSCSLGREAMRHPLTLLAGPRGDTLHVVGHIDGNGLGIGLMKLGGAGVATSVKGPTGCLLGGTIGTIEKTPCNHPFAAGTITNADSTLTLTPDGRSAYVLDQVPATDFARLNLLQRRP
ncbi:MAG: hypothetical protein QOH13_2704 [Thermoleophilaceae bacterium]|nr:hypothetical protein [Thermoleophilaceae bacterium]